MTATPGVWYHGSPNPYLLELKSGDEVQLADPDPTRWEQKHGIYFTQDRGCAEFYAGMGRVYDVELNTRSVLTVEESEFPAAEPNGNAILWAKLFARAEAEGHDCILIPHRWNELCLLDASCIRHLSPLIPPLETKTPGIFYRGDYDEWDCGVGLMYTTDVLHAKAHTRTRTCPPPCDIITERAAIVRVKPHPSRVPKLVAKVRKQKFQALIFNETCVMVLDSSCVRQLEPARTAAQQWLDQQLAWGAFLRGGLNDEQLKKSIGL